MVSFFTGLLALKLTPLARIASSTLHEPKLSESGFSKMPRRWKPRTSVRWQRNWIASQCRPNFSASMESCRSASRDWYHYVVSPAMRIWG